MDSAITSHEAGCPINDKNKLKVCNNANSFDENLIESAKLLMHFRRELEKYFPRFTFHDESWDVLLELFLSTAHGEELCVKQVLLSTGMPATSAMRLLERLEGAGLIFKSRSIQDRRQTMVNFTEEGIQSTASMLKAFSRIVSIRRL